MLTSKTTRLDDQALIQEYRKSGDLEVLGFLFGRYASLAYGVSLKYLKNRDDAKDAVMQVFEKLVKSLREHQVENFKSWLYVTTRNHCLMQLRALKAKGIEQLSQRHMESEVVLHLDEEPEMELNLGKLEKCIEALVEDQRQCVRLFYLEEKCYKEVAVLTGFDLHKVKSHIQNGKRNLKICMDGNG